MKVWTLVITNGSYMDVEVFYGDNPPLPNTMVSRIDFDENPTLLKLLTELCTKFTVKSQNQDYFIAIYYNAGSKYIFHLKCHIPEDCGFTLTGS
jgi:hypothetical protein